MEAMGQRKIVGLRVGVADGRPRRVRTSKLPPEHQADPVGTPSDVIAAAAQVARSRVLGWAPLYEEDWPPVALADLDLPPEVERVLSSIPSPPQTADDLAELTSRALFDFGLPEYQLPRVIAALQRCGLSLADLPSGEVTLDNLREVAAAEYAAAAARMNEEQAERERRRREARLTTFRSLLSRAMLPCPPDLDEDRLVLDGSPRILLYLSTSDNRDHLCALRECPECGEFNGEGYQQSWINHRSDLAPLFEPRHEPCTECREKAAETRRGRPAIEDLPAIDRRATVALLGSMTIGELVRLLSPGGGA